MDISLRRRLLPPLPRPPFLHDLPPASDSQRILRDIVGNARRRSYVRTFANAHGRNQGTVAANKNSVVYHRLMFVEPVVVTGNRPRPDVDPSAYFRVSQIGQVVRLRSLTQFDLLRLDKISHVSAVCNLALRTQVRIWPYNRARTNLRFLHYAPGPDHHVIPNLRIANHAIRSHPAPRANLSRPDQLNIGFDHRVRRNLDICVDHTRCRIEDRDSLRHQLPAFRSAHLLVDIRQFRPRIPA